MAFAYISSVLILLSWYFQNKNLYGNFIYKEIIFNRDILEYQLKKMSDSISTYKNIFWMFPYTVFSISIISLIFQIGNEFMYWFYILSAILLIQYIFEYYFIMNILKKHILEEQNIDKILDDLESSKSYITLEKEAPNFIKQILNKEWDNEDIEKIKLYMIKDTKGELIKDEFFAKIYDKEGTLYQLDLSTGELYTIVESDSSYYKNFYDTYSFNRIYILGYLEPIVLSIILVLGGTI